LRDSVHQVFNGPKWGNVNPKKVCVLMRLAGDECSDELVKSDGDSADRRCISPGWLCDGDDDCGNNWDETAETCG